MTRLTSEQCRCDAPVAQRLAPSRPLVRRALALAALGASLTLGISAMDASAQVMIRARGNVGNATNEPPVDQGREGQQGVSVKDSPEALKELDIADNMARQQDWTKAAGWYQQVLTKYADRVVPSHVKANNVIDQYRSITSTVQEALSKWPAAGLNAYRALYGATAASQLEQAGEDDRAGLSRVFATYFITDAGKTAGIRLMNLYIEDGDYAGAAWIGARLLDWHPNLTVERARILYRTALAQHLSGDEAAAKSLLATLRDNFADATDSVFGKDVVLTKELQNDLTVTPVTMAASDASSWPMFYGDPTRTRLSQGGGQARARYYAIDLAQEKHHTVNHHVQQQQQQAEELYRSQGMTLGIFPVVDREQMFFQDGANCYAVDLNTGLPLPGWAQTYPNSRHACYTFANGHSQHTQQYTLTVTEDSVIAVMGSELAPAPYYQQPNNPTRNTAVVCLDRQTGAVKWVVHPKDLPGDLSALDFCGSPLVVGDNVYVLTHGGKTAEFEDSQVLCLDRNTGLDARTHAPIWSSFIASATTGASMYWGGTPQRAPNYHISHLAYASGRLYALSDVGALAAIDAYTGSVAWLSIYPRDVVNDIAEMRMGRQPSRSSQVMRPWEYNPVFEQDGKLFILPTDCKYVLVYDAASGKELARLYRSDFNNAQTLLGVVGDRIVLCDDLMVWSVRWKDYVPGAKSEVEKDKYLDWYTAYVRHPSGNQWIVSRIRGRGFITADSLFIPYETCLSQISTKTGKNIVSYPSVDNPVWDMDQEGPGNVLVTPDYVVVAGAQNVDVYTDLNLASAKIEHEIREAPTDSEPWLRYAGMMFSAGKYAEVVQKMERAAELEGGWDHLHDAIARNNLFARSLDFAQKLAKQKNGDDQVIAVNNRFFDMARLAAQTPSQQVEYRIDRARFAEDSSEWAGAIGYYQEILSDASWRGVTLGDAQGQVLARQAGALAERKIGDLKTAHPDAYAPIEAQAGKALDGILAGKDVMAPALSHPTTDEASAAADRGERLLAIADSYPNSSVAPKAMIAAVIAYEEAGNVAQATQIAREAFMKYGSPGPNQAGVVEALVRNALLQPNRIEVAVGRLAALCQQGNPLTEEHLSGPLQLPNGQVLEKPTFTEALSAIEKLQIASVSVALPDLNLPLHGIPHHNVPEPFKPQAEEDRLSGVETILSPPPELRDLSRYDRIVVWRDDGLAVYAAGKSGPNDKPLLTSNVPGRCLGIAWLRDPMTFTPPAGGTPANSPSSAPVEATGSPAAAANASPPRSLLAWSAKGIAMLAPPDSGSLNSTSPGVLNWHATLGSLSPLRIVDVGQIDVADDSKDEDADDGGAYVEHIGNQTIVHVQNRVVSIYVNGNGPGEQQDDVANSSPKEEEIVQVRPTGSSVIAATNTGRIFCLRRSDGHLLWQTRLGNHKLDQLCVNSDFAVARYSRGSGPEGTQQIVVLDTFDGRVLSSKTYDTITGTAPVNMALSPDGLLVWTIPDAMYGKDLYAGGAKLTDHLKFTYYAGALPNETAAQRNQRRMMRMQMGNVASEFTRCDKPDQLLIADGRILAVEMEGAYFNVFSAQTGKPISEGENGQRIEALQTYPGSTQNAQSQLDTTLRYVAPYVYSITTRGIEEYNVNNIPGGDWSGIFVNNTGSPMQNLHSVIDPNCVVILASMTQSPRGRRHRADADAAAIPSHWFRLYDFRREGGNLVTTADIKESSAAIMQWEACDGGMYYLTDDHVLHFLAGAR